MDNEKIWLSSPHMSGNEMKYIQEAFDSNWISPFGPNIDGFEKDLETYLGKGTYVAAVSSGTAALHLETLFNSGLSLPSGTNITDDDKEKIYYSFRKIFKHI